MLHHLTPGALSQNLVRAKRMIKAVLASVRTGWPLPRTTAVTRPQARPRSQNRTLFLSDLHLGASGARADLALAFLQDHAADTYVLVGDILDLWQPGPAQWGTEEQAVVDHLRDRHRNGAEIVYVTGNHDPDPQAAFASGHLPVRAQKRADHVTADGRRFLVVHGDAADIRLFQSLTVSRACAWTDRRLRSLDQAIGAVFARSGPAQRSTIEYLLSSLNRLLYPTDGHELRLVEQAWQGGYDGVICGHFHMSALHDRHGLVYANCGDWLDSFTALTEGYDGRLTLTGGRGMAAFDHPPQPYPEGIPA